MKSISYLSLFLLLAGNALAQKGEIIRVPAGQDLATVVSEYGVYRLPAFTKGTVYFKDGNMGKEMMNYNILSGQMLYIDKQGDTLAISIPDEIKKLDINGAIFYYNNKTYLEELAATPAASLVMQRFVAVRFEKKGAFGSTDPSGSITSYNTYFAGVGTSNASYRLLVNEDAVVRKQNVYYLLTSSNLQLPANKRGFMDAFPRNRKKLESYLDNNKADFNSVADLIQLMGVGVARD